VTKKVLNWVLSTGAFEIYIGNVKKFSALKKGRLPTVEELNLIFAEYNVKFNKL
jgi:hypothetical protein